MNQRKNNHEAQPNALASVRMEGFHVTQQMEQDCVRVLNGEITIFDLIQEILTRPWNGNTALRSDKQR